MSSVALTLIIAGGSMVYCTLNEGFKKTSNDNNSKYNRIKDETFNYWMDLTSREQEEYFYNNEVLRDYRTSLLYSNRYQTAKKVSELSYKLGRKFSNLEERY